MKQQHLWLGLFAACLTATTGHESSAAITIQDGIPWVYSVGSHWYSESRDYNSSFYSTGAAILHGPGRGDVTIPSDLDGYPVTDIGPKAFYMCSNLTSVTVPDSVTNICSAAFSGCTGLKTLYLPPSMAGTTQAANAGVPATCVVIYGDAEGEAWSYVVEDAKATVTAGPRQGDVIVPSVLGGYPVTGIGSNAFYNSSGLSSVTIPNSVTNIGSDAFYGCRGLTAVNIHDLKAWCEIDFGNMSANPVYYARRLYLNGEKVAGDVVIPDGTKTIGICAFYSSGLTSVAIPDSVTRIENYAFTGCTIMTALDIGNGVTNIGSEAFTMCVKLTTVTIPDSVTSIGEKAFFACTNLTAVDIGNGVTSIGSTVFSDCPRLATLTIGNGVKNIGAGAFSSCTNLTAVNIHDLKAWCEINFGNQSANPVYYAKHLYLNGEEVTGHLVIPSGTKTIGSCAFNYFTNLTSVTIADSVTSIGDYAFSWCDGLTSVDIGNGVTNIGSRAFSGCANLTAVTIPDSVTSIGDYAFSWCDGLTAVDIGNGVTSIGSTVFTNCTSLATVTIGNGVTNIGNYAFSGCTNLTAMTIPDSVTSIGDYAFSRCNGLTSVDIGNGVTSIGSAVFTNCTSLATVTIGNGVTNIGNYAFSGCTNLTAVTIADSVTSIGNYAFSSCNGLTLVDIGNGVTSIGSTVFSGCARLATLTIGNGVTNIGAAAFSSCTNLTAVNIHDLKAWCEINFGNWSANPLYYAKHLYLDGEEVAGNLEIPSGTKTIGRYAFYYCTNLTSVTIPDSVTSIGGDAFWDCSGLTSVDIGNGVTNIGERAFSSCYSLTAVDIGNGVMNIGERAFFLCYRLTAVTIPGSVTGIGTNAFDGCRGLKTVYAPASWESKYVNGTFWIYHAGVPSGCTIVYYEPEASAVTTTAVPHTWLAGYGLGDGTAAGYEAAANAKAANGRKVWECYVLGLDPRKEDKDFTVAISFPDGPSDPNIEWNPDLNENGTKAERVYEVEGTPTLTNDWGPRDDDSRFFRVKVGLPPK